MHVRCLLGNSCYLVTSKPFPYQKVTRVNWCRLICIGNNRSGLYCIYIFYIAEIDSRILQLFWKNIEVFDPKVLLSSSGCSGGTSVELWLDTRGKLDSRGKLDNRGKLDTREKLSLSWIYDSAFIPHLNSALPKYTSHLIEMHVLPVAIVIFLQRRGKKEISEKGL